MISCDHSSRRRGAGTSRIATFLIVLAGLGCDRAPTPSGVGTVSAGPKTQPIIKKKLSELTADDLKRAAAQLGLGEKKELVVRTTVTPAENAASFKQPVRTFTLMARAPSETILALYTFAERGHAEGYGKILRTRQQITRIEGVQLFVVSCSKPDGSDCPADPQLIPKLFGN